MKNAVTNQPKALPYLFLTEMWERFGFYVVQGLLVLYMTQFFGFSDSKSYTILGVFTALVYISPLIGGYLANHALGYRRAITWGGFLLIIGYVLMALPHADVLIYPALATIIVGNGLFKPNISSLLGTQYKETSLQRDTGFTIFYIGINIGSLLAGLSSGYIKEYFGWHVSFALASVGLLIGIATFKFAQSTIQGNDNFKKISPKFTRLFVFYAILAIVGLSFLMRVQALSTWLLPLVGILLLVGLVNITIKQPPAARYKMMVLNTLVLSSVIFWMLFLQMFYSVNLFIDRLVDKNFFGLHLTTTVFYASESVFIILLGPLFAWYWHTLGRREKNPSPIKKFTLGILFTGVGFMMLSTSTFHPNALGLINPLWIFSSYLLITIGELLISPIGLSAVTKLAPASLAGMMMGVWFVATGFGGMFAGWLAQLSNVPAYVTSTTDKLLIYRHAFTEYSYFAFGIVVILLFINLTLEKLVKKSKI